MEKSVLERVQSFIEDTGETKNSLANKCGMAPQTFWRYVNGDNKITVSLLESLLDVYPSLSAEWLLRGEGEKYKTDVPRDTDTEEVADLRAELTRVHAERDEYKQIIEELKRKAKEWKESDEYEQTIAELRAEAADLRARLDEQRKNFRVLAEFIGKQQQPTTGAPRRFNIAQAVALAAGTDKAVEVPVLTFGDAALPEAIVAKGRKSKKNIG